MNCDEALKLHQYLNENLSKKFIQINHLQTVISVLFVKKSEEELCFCVNYKGLNAITVKNHYSLLLISETFNYLNYTKIFIKLNIISAFNKFWIKEKNEAFTVFHIWFDFFEYLIMPFSLCNGPASFQKYINDTFYKYLNKFCTAYLNNILIYSDNETKHEIYIKHVFQKLKETDLQTDIIKCVFHIT